MAEIIEEINYSENLSNIKEISITQQEEQQRLKKFSMNYL